MYTRENVYICVLIIFPLVSTNEECTPSLRAWTVLMSRWAWAHEQLWAWQCMYSYIRSCRMSRWAYAHEQLWACPHTLIAQNCSRHDFESVKKSIRSSSSLNGPYKHMRGQCRSMFNYVKLLYFCNKWFITLISVPIYASKAVWNFLIKKSLINSAHTHTYANWRHMAGRLWFTQHEHVRKKACNQHLNLTALFGTYANSHSLLYITSTY